MSTELKKSDVRGNDLRSYVKTMMPEITKALPSVITPERFGRMITTALSSNDKLMNCTPISFVGAMMNSAQLGLEPNTPLGQAYLIPYKNKGVDEVQFQIGYKGLIELANRSGEFKNISAHEVYENDEFVYEYGLDPKLIHKPALKNRGEVICYYACYTLTNGGCGFEVMSKEDIEAHKKKYSKAANSSFSPWSNNYDEMAKKTVIKRVLKYAPLKTEVAMGVGTDEMIPKYNEEANDIVFEDTIEATATVREETVEL